MIFALATIAGFILIALIAWVFSAPQQREEDEAEWMILGNILFGDINDGD